MTSPKLDKTKQSKIEYITTQLSPPSGSNQGVIAEGWFTVIGGELSLVDRTSGKPVRDGRGKLYIRQLHKDEDPRRIAQRMLKEFHDATRGNKSDFHRPISYSNSGIV